MFLFSFVFLHCSLPSFVVCLCLFLHDCVGFSLTLECFAKVFRNLLALPRATMASSSSNIVARSLTAMEERIAQLERELAECSSDDSDAASEDPPPPAKKQRGRPPAPTAAAAGEQSSGDASKPLSLHCALCNKSVTSEKLMHEHLGGRAHKHMLARSEGRYCVCCKIEFTSSRQLEDHSKGRKHREKQRVADREQDGRK